MRPALYFKEKELMEEENVKIDGRGSDCKRDKVGLEMRSKA